MEKGYTMARKAIESTYNGWLIAYEYKDVTDPETKTTKQTEVPVLTKIPCRLSYENITNAIQTETVATVSQVVKLFISPDTVLKVGSKIVILQNGVQGEYQFAGTPSIYPTHKEYILIPFEGYT